MRIRSLLIAAMALSALPAARAAETLPFPPTLDKVCTAGLLDKAKVADYLVRKYPLTALTGAVAADLANKADAPAPRSNQELLATLLGINNVCNDEKKKNRCGAADPDYLIRINGDMKHLLSGQQKAYLEPRLARREDVDPRNFFSAGSKSEVACLADPPGSTPTSTEDDDSNFRFRGNPAQLYLSRTDPAFKDADKATLSFLKDQAAGTSTSKGTAYLGYAVSVPGLDTLVPYAGINRNVVTPDPGSSAKPSYASTDAYGVLFGKFVPESLDGMPSHRLNLRPELLVDHGQGSRLYSLNLEYIPGKLGWLNDYRQYANGKLGFRPILSLKNNYGHYADSGKPQFADANKNFNRLGAQAGVGFYNDILVSFDGSLTYVKLHDTLGSSDVSYMKAAVNWNLDEKKYFGISFSTSHGYREDTAKLEHKREIALAFRY